MIETVQDNFHKFAKKEIERATLARKVQHDDDPPNDRLKQKIYNTKEDKCAGQN